MPSITITLTADQISKLIEATTSKYAPAGGSAYQTEIPDPNDPDATIPNPESAADFTRRKLTLEHFRAVWVSYRAAVKNEEKAATIDEANAEMDGMDVS